MKQLNQYIIEKFKINSKTVCNQNEKEMDYKSFIDYIKELFSIKEDKDIDQIIRCFSTDINLDKFKKNKITLIDKDHGLYDSLANICADLINHPNKYQKLSSIDFLYSTQVTNTIEIDLRILKYTLYNKDSNQDKYFLFFLNYNDDKFYIFKYEDY